MSDTATALGGARFSGLVTVTEAAPQGMILLRGDLAARPVRSVCKTLAGADVPGPNRAVANAGPGGEKALCWMAPDELLILLPPDRVAEALTKIGDALGAGHYLAQDMSGARARFDVEGAVVRDVLAKLTPADLRADAFGPGHFRRTRLAQIPAALWLREPDRASVFCFRSVARYAFDLLSTAAAPASAVNYF